MKEIENWCNHAGVKPSRCLTGSWCWEGKPKPGSWRRRVWVIFLNKVKRLPLTEPKPVEVKSCFSLWSIGRERNFNPLPQECRLKIPAWLAMLYRRLFCVCACVSLLTSHLLTAGRTILECRKRAFTPQIWMNPSVFKSSCSNTYSHHGRLRSHTQSSTVFILTPRVRVWLLLHVFDGCWRMWGHLPRRMQQLPL